MTDFTIGCIWEHNGNDSLLFCRELPGAFTRGAAPAEALRKMPREAASYMKWAGMPVPDVIFPEIIQEKASSLDICDADSDVLFDSERAPLSMAEYSQLKSLVMKSARDFHRLYESIPEKDVSCILPRKTFYGAVPQTAGEMYIHTRSVNAYYFGEIDIEANQSGSIWECRARGFDTLEASPDFLKNTVYDGSYGENWSLRKVMRRFIWHDRIHAKAMYRMACRTFSHARIPDIFCFEA